VSKRSAYRAALESIPHDQWVSYLDSDSGLPGPWGNIELAEAFADVAEPAFIRSCARSQNEYLAMCGAVGFGRLLADGDRDAVETLKSLAADSRWRVREGVAMALQRLGDANMSALWAATADWVAGPPLVQRAIAAGICEPRLLGAPDNALRALDTLDRITESLKGMERQSRRAEPFRVLRLALGYCWSVAVAAAPAEGFVRLERWAASDDKDVRWIVRENLRKARLARADLAASERVAAVLDRGR
jgi:hypothetical protein